MSQPLWLDRDAWPFAPRWCRVTGGRLHYVDEGHGPSVVLVHGTPTWGFEWRHAIRSLRDSFRVIVPDHLGFGLSERPPDASYSPEAHAQRFDEFMAAIVPTGEVSLVVHDFGGPIALGWAQANASRVRTLTIVNSWMWSFAADPLMRRRAAMAATAPFRWLYRYANASLSLIMPSAYGDRRRLTPAIHAQYRAVFPDPTSRELVLFALARALSGSASFYESLWQRRTLLRDVPMSILWGMRDNAFQPPILAQWSAAYPHAAVTRFADAGHWPHEEEPMAFVDALAKELRRADGRD